MYNKKAESISGTVTGKVVYRAGNDGKKSFLALSLFIEKKGKREIRKLKAFDAIADNLAHLSESDPLTVSVYQSKNGEDVIDSYHEQIAGNTTVIRRTSVMSKSALQERNKELAREGLALVPIKLASGQILATKRLSDCLKVDGEWVCKLEYLMDTLGIDAIKHFLKEAGLLESVKVTSFYGETYRKTLSTLLSKVLTDDLRD